MKETMKSPTPSGELSLGDTVTPKFDSQTLFSGQQEICIEHAGNAYRLRITRQDKLILTK